MAKYKNRTVKLNKPSRGDVKKFKVFVKDTYVCNKWRKRHFKR